MFDINDYVMRDGSYCPECDSDNIEGTNGPEFEDGKLYMRVECRNCSYQWDEVFTLIGICTLDGEETLIRL